MREPTKLAIAGDWHGNGYWAKQAINRAHEQGADAMVQVGDFGYWTFPNRTTYLDQVSSAVRKTGIDFYWLPGNHECWTDLPENGRGKQTFTERGLTFLPIGYRWEWWGKRFMAVGGAFSVDRFMRKEGKSWWPEEILTDADVDWACHQPHGMDVILSHDCPEGVSIPGIGPASKQRPDELTWPPDMLAGANAHRKKMRSIWEKHGPQLWVHGHYHTPYEAWMRVPGSEGNTVFKGLDMDATNFSRNVMYLEPGDLK